MKVSTTNVTKDASIELSCRQAVRMVSRCVAERKPIAVVRFGEGEARLLAANLDQPESVSVAIRKLGRQTGLFFSPGEMLKVKELLMTALDEADVVGLRVSENFAPEHKEWGEKVAAIYDARTAHRKRMGYVGHCLVNHHLNNALPELLAEQRCLSVISCRDLATTLRESYELDDVAVYQLPSEYVLRDVDDDYEAALHDVPLWPDLYEQVRDEIEVRERGEVFLVGAGIFGKELCIRIREKGGIALDMGSTLDRMAGKTTRGRNRPIFRVAPESPRVVKPATSSDDADEHESHQPAKDRPPPTPRRDGVISYSQVGEDLLIEYLLGTKKDLRYVDVGCLWPIKYSNTYLFYTNSGVGLCLDANPDLETDFRTERPRDIFLNVAIGANTDILTYYKFNAPGFNTFSAERAAHLMKQAQVNPGRALREKVEVPVITLDAALAMIDLPTRRDGRLDFLSIDVEGLELDVLSGFSFEPKPRLIVCEQFRRNGLPSAEDERLNQMLIDRGYREAAYTGHDVFFLAADA